MGPEKKIQDKIQKTLKSLGIYVERRQISGVGAKKGKPDLWIVYKGHHVEIEVKAPGGELSTMQMIQITKFQSQNVPCIVVESVEEVLEYLKSID